MNRGVPLSGKQTVDGLADQWGKLLAIVMLKHGILDTTLSAADIDALGADGQMAYCLVPGPGDADGVRLRLMKTADAIAEAKKHKGGFGFS